MRLIADQCFRCKQSQDCFFADDLDRAWHTLNLIINDKSDKINFHGRIVMMCDHFDGRTTDEAKTVLEREKAKLEIKVEALERLHEQREKTIDELTVEFARLNKVNDLLIKELAKASAEKAVLIEEMRSECLFCKHGDKDFDEEPCDRCCVGTSIPKYENMWEVFDFSDKVEKMLRGENK